MSVTSPQKKSHRTGCSPRWRIGEGNERAEGGLQYHEGSKGVNRPETPELLDTDPTAKEYTCRYLAFGLAEYHVWERHSSNYSIYWWCPSIICIEQHMSASLMYSAVARSLETPGILLWQSPWNPLPTWQEPVVYLVAPMLIP